MKITEISKKYAGYYRYFRTRPKVERERGRSRGKLNRSLLLIVGINISFWHMEVTRFKTVKNFSPSLVLSFGKFGSIDVFVFSNIKILLQWKSFSRKLKLILSSLITPRSFEVKRLKLALVPPTFKLSGKCPFQCSQDQY